METELDLAPSPRLHRRWLTSLGLAACFPVLGLVGQILRAPPELGPPGPVCERGVQWRNGRLVCALESSATELWTNWLMGGRGELNRATVEDLQQVPGVGPALAGRMVSALRQRRFASVDELEQVRGVGPRLVERMKRYFVVGSTQ